MSRLIEEDYDDLPPEEAYDAWWRQEQVRRVTREYNKRVKSKERSSARRAKEEREWG